MVTQRITGGERENDVPAAWSPYPVDQASLQSLADWTSGVRGQDAPTMYHPTRITLLALQCWNQYLATGLAGYREAFVIQARWLLEHEVRIGKDTGGWPLMFAHPDVHAQGSCLSALTQGSAISVLL